ncbi:hypothetical protein NEILACOT_05659 [Neisseria lactamica ATCC 23970]|uniref:Uncharacterized protein n=1 Tax=Neisseria lactamica ATCC 23970 TaxID=546265 RepID=D0WDM3_NEILA|nr:hypothetical protein NEILACOT_05659 [Neisseria lactamica ATCC 23970]
MNTPLHLFIGCSPIAHKPHACENRTESSKKTQCSGSQQQFLNKPANTKN